MNESRDYSYVLVTPAKNEQESLTECIKSVINQSKKPLIWVIIDDGSTDKTPQIIKNAENNYEWIKCIRLDSRDRDLGIHIAKICNIGLNFVTKSCKSKDIEFKYIGILDADIILDKNYYENLIDKFSSNPKLGIISGSTTCLVDGKLIYMDQPNDLPSGAARLWRKECFADTGYDLTYASDSVSTVKAKLRGWETKRYFEYPFIQYRLTASANGVWNGWKSIGERNYYIGFPLSYAILKSIKYAFKSPYYLGIAYLLGYLTFLLKKKQTHDKEILNYYRHTRPYETRTKYYRKLKKTLRLR